MLKFRTCTRSLMIGMLALMFGSSFLRAQEPNPIKPEARLTPAQCYQKIWQDVQSRSWPNAPAQWHKFKDRQPKTVDELREMLQEAFAASNSSLKVLNASDLAKLTSAQAGGYPGIGVSMEFGAVVTNGVKLYKVFEDSPAQDAGLKPGDLLTHVDGAPIAGWSVRQVTLILRGEAGTPVALTINRDGHIDNIAVERGVDGKLGVELEAHEPRHQFIVTDVQDGTPAARAGIKVGDIFVAVDGHLQCDLAMYFDPKESREAHAALVAQNEKHLASPVMFIRQSSEGKLGGEIKLDMKRSGTAYSATLTREAIPHGSQRMLHASRTYPGSKLQTLGWTQYRINNLDWNGLIADLDKSLEDAKSLPGLILDLRGAGGSNPQIAAELVARFAPGQTVFGFTRLDDIKEAANYTVAAPPVVYPGNLEVLVDGQTTGTAQAVAAALQSSHRAKLRGEATKGLSTVSVQFNYEVEVDSKVTALSVLIPALNLVKDSNGSDLSGLSPDFKETAKDDGAELSFFDEVSKHAQAAVDPGEETNYAALAIAICILAAGLATIALTVWLWTRLWVWAVRRSSRLRSIEQSPKTPWVIAVVLLLVLGTLAVYLKSPTEKAVRGEVVVKLILDDSPRSKAQLKVAQQLEKEYSGPIRFVVIEASKVKPEDNPPDNIQVPNVQVCEFWYAADGKCVASSWHSGGLLTKPEMVRSIEQSIDQGNGREKLPIVRQKP